MENIVSISIFNYAYGIYLISSTCRMLKLADKPSCLGGEDPVPIAIGIGAA